MKTTTETTKITENKKQTTITMFLDKQHQHEQKQGLKTTPSRLKNVTRNKISSPKNSPKNSPKSTKKSKKEEQQKTVNQLRGYWTEFARKQKQEDRKPENYRHRDAQKNPATQQVNCRASATTAGRHNDVDIPVNSDVSGFDRPPEVASRLASMKEKVNKLLPGSNLEGKVENKIGN